MYGDFGKVNTRSVKTQLPESLKSVVQAIGLFKYRKVILMLKKKE